MNERLQKGDRVQVSNGQPCPPVHHTKKARAWKAKNYTGTVVEDENSYIEIEPDGEQSRAVRVRQLYRRINMDVTITKMEAETA